MKRNWDRDKERRSIHRHGFESLSGASWQMPSLSAPTIKPSKAELREQAARAIAEFKGEITRCPPPRKR
jgi:uncharacterized DUF497 family protein